MDFRSSSRLILLSGLALMLTSCGGSSKSSTPPPTTYTLSVTAPASGAGTITSSPSGINCPGTCSASFAQGTQVTLTASPATGYTFAGWSGSCTGTGTCTVTMTAAANVSATFNAQTANSAVLTVTLAGAGQGSVVSSPAGINCTTGTCTASFPVGTQVMLTETPGANSGFTSWTGCTGTPTCTFTLSAAQTVTATFGPTNPYAAINHIILFAQENRSLDHYLGYLRQYWANNSIPDQSFDGLPQFNPTSGAAPLQGPAPTVPGCQLSSDVTSCTPDPTNPITSFSFDTVPVPSGTGMGTECEENQSPFWNEAHNDWSLADPADQTGAPAALDGFVYTAAYDARSNAFMDVNGVRAMGYYTDKDLNLAYALVTAYGTSDRFFSPVMDRTQLNRAYIYAATSQGYAYPPGSNSKDNAAFTAKTIFEALQDAGISWKIYVDPTGAFYTNPTTQVTTNCETATAGQEQDLCLAGASYMNQFVYEATIQNDPSNGLWEHFAPISQFATDLGSDSTFPQFAMIDPASSAGLDEHPSDTDTSPVNIQLGEQYLQNTVLTPFLQSPTYKDSALIITYDEAGGLYDHVSPQPAAAPQDDPNPIDLQPGDICDNSGQVLGTGTCTFGWTGYRVPLMVISPFTKKNYVSHTTRDTTAVLSMVETRFGLPALTARDASYMTPAASWDEFFDFVNIPNATPPTNLPTQSVAGNCDQTPPSAWNEPPELTVTVKGLGNVTSTPASGVNTCTTECTGVFATGTVVTLTATPSGTGTFTGWSGACTGATTCSVTVGTHDYVTATFTP